MMVWPGAFARSHGVSLENDSWELEASLPCMSLHGGMCCRAIEREQGQLCILADDCNQPDYKKLIEHLCQEKNVDLVCSLPRSCVLCETHAPE